MATGITTYSGQVHRGLSFKNNNVLWLAIGRTSAWTDDAHPPAEVVSDTDITQIKGYFKITNKEVCYPVSSGGDVTVVGQQYKFSSDVNAYTNVARFVYLKYTITGADFVESPTYEYRQIGIYSNLTPVTAHIGDTILDPANVYDNGVLEYYSNETPTERRSDRNDIAEIVLEFF